MKQNSNDGSFTVQLPLKNYSNGFQATQEALKKAIEKMKSRSLFCEFNHPIPNTVGGNLTLARCFQIDLQNACAQLTSPEVTYDDEQNIIGLKVKVLPLSGIFGNCLTTYLIQLEDPGEFLFGLRGVSDGANITEIVTWDFLGGLVERKKEEARIKALRDGPQPTTLDLDDGRVLKVGSFYWLKEDGKDWQPALLSCYFDIDKFVLSWKLFDNQDEDPDASEFSCHQIGAEIPFQE